MLRVAPVKSAFSTDVDNRLLRGSFNRYGWPRPELRLRYDSANGRLRGTAALR